MLLKAALLVLGSAVLISLVVCVAAALIYLDGPMWANLVTLALVGLVVVIAQIALAVLIEEGF